MFGCVFYADILGFGELSGVTGAGPARAALHDISQILSTNEELSRYLRRDNWLCRYALSDSLFLVSENAPEACAAAAEILFSLAFINASHEDAILQQSVLLRGGVSCGDFHEIGPLFPETAKGNLVGEAVVQSVYLERSLPKGPRLFISDDVATLLEGGGRESVDWIVDRVGDCPAEILWLLPPVPAEANGTMIGDLCDAAVRLFSWNCDREKVGLHYAGYLDLVARSLERLRERNPNQAFFAIRKAGFERVKSASKSDEVSQFFEEVNLTSRLEKLSGFAET